MVKKSNNQNLLVEIKKSLDLLILIELCKTKADRNQIRGILGKADNNLISKINMLIKGVKNEK